MASYAIYIVYEKKVYTVTVIFSYLIMKVLMKS